MLLLLLLSLSWWWWLWWWLWLWLSSLSSSSSSSLLLLRLLLWFSHLFNFSHTQTNNASTIQWQRQWSVKQQSTNQSTNEQSINRSNESIKQSINQPFNQSINQSSKQAINQSINQSPSHIPTQQPTNQTNTEGMELTTLISSRVMLVSNLFAILFTGLPPNQSYFFLIDLMTTLLIHWICCFFDGHDLASPRKLDRRRLSDSVSNMNTDVKRGGKRGIIARQARCERRRWPARRKLVFLLFAGELKEVGFGQKIHPKLCRTVVWSSVGLQLSFGEFT